MKQKKISQLIHPVTYFSFDNNIFIFNELYTLFRDFCLMEFD